MPTSSQKKTIPVDVLQSLGQDLDVLRLRLYSASAGELSRILQKIIWSGTRGVFWGGGGGTGHGTSKQAAVDCTKRKKNWQN